jgi:hypothetical protein
MLMGFCCVEESRRNALSYCALYRSDMDSGFVHGSTRHGQLLVAS